MNVIKENKKPIIVAIVQWFVTSCLQIDRLFFTYIYENKYFLTIKALYLVFLLIVWSFIFTAVKMIRTGNEIWKRGFFVFKVYFTCMMMLLLVLWPGTWAWDDIWTLNAISTYGQWHAWQHVLTGIYYDVLLQILPFPGGIIFLQNVIISVCVAFVVTKLEYSFRIKRVKNVVVDIVVKLVPFMAPPILMYQFSGYRMGIYVYLELVMLVIFITTWKDKQEWSLKLLLFVSVLCVIVAAWRTESFLYIPLFCLLSIFNKNVIVSNKRKVLSITICLIGFLGLNQLQNSELGDSNYKVISLLCPCAELVRAADSEADAKELAMIDKVADLEVIRDNPSLNGNALYWSTGCVRNLNDDPEDDYTEDDYKEFLKGVVKLSLKYPDVVASERWNIFIKGSGITGESSNNVNNAAALFEPDNGNSAAETTFAKGWVAYSPVYKRIRHLAISTLGIRKNDGTVIEWLYRIVWNAIIPEVILLYAWIKMLIKKKWFLAGIGTVVLGKLVLVALTQPCSMIMYLLSFYLLGYVFLVYAILVHWTERKNKEIIKDE